MEKILGEAYMRLYDAYVEAFLADGNTNGQAWYYAVGITRAILDSYGADKSNSAIKYLEEFAKSHDMAIKRKSMDSVHRDEYGDPESVPENTTIKAARDELKSIIKAVGDTKVLKFGLFKSHYVSQIPKQPRSRGFVEWLNTYTTGINVTNIADNPRAFAKLYRRYVLRGTGK